MPNEAKPALGGKNTNIVIVIVLTLIVGLGAFFGGMKYQESKLSKFTGRLGQFPNGRPLGENTNNPGIQNRARNGSGQIIGEISSVDAKSITIKMTDSSSKIVLLSDKTTINKATEGQVSDLVVGVKVAIVGVTNTDGSISGQNIQLNPATRNPETTPPVRP